MNLENMSSIVTTFLFVIIGVPWFFGAFLLCASWFGDGLSSGKQTEIIKGYEKLITDCEINLSRNEFCELVAQKTRSSS